jgi:hypothetical protein
MHMVARDKIIRYVTPLFVNVILQWIELVDFKNPDSLSW